jgi:3-hydroxyisobutyrate dehydrogenase-like beta-hydroxyacid dehydrogenase
MQGIAQEGPALGFIGLGAMGGGMAMNLVRAGCPLTVYDLKADRLADCAAAGAVAAGSSREVVQRSEIVLTSLRSSAVFVEVAEGELLPAARAGQIFMDMGTTEAPETRRLSAAFAAKGAALVDAPVSGGPGGAAGGTLHIFVGGDEAAVEKVRPILDVLGDPRHVARCGPSGCGQVVKGVNQLAMGLVAAAYLEAIAFGVRGGADLDAIAASVGGEEGWRKRLADYAGRVRDGSAESVYVKFPELPYFLREAREQGFEMPMTEALFRFCDAGPRNWRDNMQRECVAFWHQLMQAGR